jgi:hypothetical protein
MKKIMLVCAIGAILSSCGAECDTSTAEGAANCWCDLMDEAAVAAGSGDAVSIADVEERMEKAENEIEGHLEAGDYTENELEALLEEKNCD